MGEGRDLIIDQQIVRVSLNSCLGLPSTTIRARRRRDTETFFSLPFYEGEAVKS